VKAFIDGGAYNGDTVKLFLKGGIVKRDDLEEFVIYAFDPLFPEIDWIDHRVMGTEDNVLAVEFHSFHLPYKDREEKLRKSISDMGITFIDWQLYND
jgi:hypothetical protein